jgi:hypothetical protein
MYYRDLLRDIPRTGQRSAVTKNDNDNMYDECLAVKEYVSQEWAFNAVQRNRKRSNE